MLRYNNYSDKLRKIKSGQLSLIRNVEECLKRIEDNQDINAFNSVFAEDSLKQAKLIEEKILSGSHGKLAGMTIAVKDVLALKDKPLTCSSKMLKNFISIYTATAVQRLIDEDAIIIGKANCDEFAMGSSNETSAFGAVLNPVDKARVPGGSSGGSAAAVAAGLCDAALGSDTGGSVRQPAAFCGVYGLKPTYGRISRCGLTAFASSFDTVGILTNNVYDSALLLEVISGGDEHDSTSSYREVEAYTLNLQSNSNLKIGIAEEFFTEALQPEIKGEVEQVINRLKAGGFEIKKITLPYLEYSTEAYCILSMAEASSNLSRYDGVRYGSRVECATVEDMYVKTRTDNLGTEVKRRIMLGTYILSGGYHKGYYTKAQKVRRLIKNSFDAAFKDVDIILTPTTPTTAFKIGEKLHNPLSMYLNDIYTTPAGLAGLPAINIPSGRDNNGLPIGIQLISAQFNEIVLLQCAGYLQNFTL